MLSKIFILLAGQPSETSSYLADVATEINERPGGEAHPLLKCQDVITSHEVNVQDCGEKKTSPRSSSAFHPLAPF